MSGWLKIGNGASIAMTIGFFAAMHIPTFLVYVVGYLELIGGVCLVLGVKACKAAAVLGVIMLFAIGYSWAYAPMLNMPAFQAIVPALAVLASLLSLVASGGGKYSVWDKKPN